MNPLPPLNICVVTQQLGQVYSGPGVHAGNLARRLAASGHRVWVVAPEGQRPPGDLPCQFAGVAAPALAGSQARWFDLSRRFAAAIARLEAQTRFDLIHFTDAREALFCRSSAPLIGNINDTYSAELHALGYYRAHYHDGLLRWAYYQANHRLESAALRKLALVLANSHFTRDTVAAAYPRSADRLRVCYKSVDAARFAPALALRAQKQPGRPPRVLFIGGNMQRKGIVALIQAMPALQRSHPGLELWVAGQDAAVPGLQALCAQQGVAETVRFLGWKSQDELIELYAGADVFAMPSLTEAFGVVFLEAMAAGVPVVGSRVGGIPEIIVDGESGRLVPPEQPRELAAAILDCLDKAEFYRNGGLHRVAQFSVERMMDCTYQAYAEVLGHAGKD